MKDTKAAFLWITEILDRHGVPYQLSGGFAASIYGCDRDLADIDIDCPRSRLAEIMEEIEPFIVFGPDQYKDESFDLQLTSLEYAEQEIDLADCESVMLFDCTRGEWVQEDFDFEQREYHEIFGRVTPVIGRGKLIEYKSIIRREVDLEDLRQLGAL